MNETDNPETADDAGGVTIPAEETDAASDPTSPDAGDTGQDAGQGGDTNHDADTGPVPVTPLEPAIPVTVTLSGGSCVIQRQSARSSISWRFRPRSGSYTMRSTDGSRSRIPDSLNRRAQRFICRD